MTYQLDWSRQFYNIHWHQIALQTVSSKSLSFVYHWHLNWIDTLIVFFEGFCHNNNNHKYNNKSNWNLEGLIFVGGRIPENLQALTGDTVLCSWARHWTLTLPLSTQVYKRVPRICRGNLTNCGKVTCHGLAYCQGQVEKLLATSC